MDSKAVDSKYEGFGERYMKKRGWTEGTGLGKDGKGISTFITQEVRKKTYGIGFKEIKKV